MPTCFWNHDSMVGVTEDCGGDTPPGDDSVHSLAGGLDAANFAGLAFRSRYETDPDSFLSEGSVLRYFAIELDEAESVTLTGYAQIGVSDSEHTGWDEYTFSTSLEAVTWTPVEIDLEPVFSLGEETLRRSWEVAWVGPNPGDLYEAYDVMAFRYLIDGNIERFQIQLCGHFL